MLLLLGVFLMILKFAGVIAWPWWIVLVPFYWLAGVLLVYAVLLVGAIISKK